MLGIALAQVVHKTGLLIFDELSLVNYLFLFVESDSCSNKICFVIEIL